MTAASSTFLASDAESYDRLMGRWSRRLAPKFLDFIGVVGGARVLDLGCGTGSLTAVLAERENVQRILGIDLSAAYIAAANARHANDRVSFEVGDACSLAVTDHAFDHSLSMLVLQFVPRADQAINEMRRVTRPGGTVAAATWDQRGGAVWSRMFWDTAAALDPKAAELRAKSCVRPMSRPGDLEQAWIAAGLTGVEHNAISIRMEYTSFDDYWAPLEGKDGPYTQYIHSLDPSFKAVLRDKVRLAYVDGDIDGPRSYASTAWVVKGKVPV